MKKYFTTGIVIFLPLILTLIIVAFLVNFLTKPFMGGIEILFQHYGWSKHFLLNNPETFKVISKMVILFTLFLAIFLVGLFGRLFLIRYFLNFGDKLIHRVPLINTIYKACQEVVNSFFSSSSTSFSQVVLVPFPTQGATSVGLVTKDVIFVHDQDQVSDLIPVFVPGTPNPTVGFLMMLKKEQLIFTDMKVEDAMKFVVSCGVVMPEFSVLPQINHSQKDITYGT